MTFLLDKQCSDLLVLHVETNPQRGPWTLGAVVQWTVPPPTGPPIARPQLVRMSLYYNKSVNRGYYILFINLIFILGMNKWSLHSGTNVWFHVDLNVHVLYCACVYAASLFNYIMNSTQTGFKISLHISSPLPLQRRMHHLQLPFGLCSISLRKFIPSHRIGLILCMTLILYPCSRRIWLNNKSLI